MGTLCKHVGVRSNSADLLSNTQGVNSLEPLSILSVYLQLYASFTWTIPKWGGPRCCVSPAVVAGGGVFRGVGRDRPQNNCVGEVTTDHTMQALLISMGQSCLQLVQFPGRLAC